MVRHTLDVVTTRRNFAVLGPKGSGKSTLVRDLASLRSANDGASDTLRVTQTVVDGATLSLIDVPGGAPRSIGTDIAISSADAVILVLSAADGIDHASVEMLEMCVERERPVLLVVTNLDRARADFDEMGSICERVMSIEPIARYLPMDNDDDKPSGLLDLLTMTVIEYGAGPRSTRPPESEHIELTAEPRHVLIETLLSEAVDDTLIDGYLDGEELSTDQIVQVWREAVVAGLSNPILPTAAVPFGYGIAELLDALLTLSPTPDQIASPTMVSVTGQSIDPIESSADGDLVARVITASEGSEQSGSWVRIHSGSLSPETAVAISWWRGEGREPITDSTTITAVDAHLNPVTATAGDVVRVTGLPVGAWGATLSAIDNPIVIR
jgi:elongation factor G